MKKTLSTLLLLCAFGSVVQGQSIIDTAAVVREVDSLIKQARAFTKQAEYEKALETNAGAKALASGKLGTESVAYGKSCYNRGWILFFKGNYREAETSYLESVAIQQKVLGREHPDYATSLNSLAIIYYYLQQYEKAEPLYLESIAIQERVLGKEHLDYANSLANLANLYMSTGKYEAAERSLLESKNIQEKKLGKEHSDVAITILNLANVYFNMRAYEKAEPLFLEAKTILEKTLGKEDAYYAWCLNYLASTFQALHKFEAAEPLYVESIAIRNKKLGNEHPEYARSLFNLANLYVKMGNYEKAEPLYVESMAIRKKVLGETHPDYLISMKDLGILYYDLGEYEKAESIILETINIWEKTAGKNDAQYLQALSILANLYFRWGSFQEAESLFLQIKSIREKTLGPIHPDYALSLNSLGVFYNTISDFKKAENYFRKALSVQDSVLDKQHSNRIATLNNLASLYKNKGEYDKAEPLYLEVLTIQKTLNNTTGSEYAGEIINLANLYKVQGRYDEAESYYLEARDIFENKLNNRVHVFYLIGLAHLADLYTQRCEYDKAESLFIEVLTQREKIFGTNHPNYGAILNHLGLLHWKTERHESAGQYFGKAVDIEKSLVWQASRHLSKQELAAYIQTFQINLDQYFSLTQTWPDTGLAGACFSNTLFYKGYLLNVAYQISKQVSADAESKEIFNRLKSINHLLAAEYTKPLSHRRNVQELEEQANALEKELAGAVAGYGEATRQISWRDVQSALRPGEAALEFIHFNYYNPALTDSVLYAALLLKPGMEYPLFIPLFEEKSLRALLPQTGGPNAEQINQLYDPESALYRLLWGPLEPHLQDVRTVYFSPSGLLHRLNLAAMSPSQPDATLADRYDLVELGSTRQLVINTASTAAVPATAVIYGGIQFDMNATAYTESPVTAAPGSRGGISFQQTDSTLRQGYRGLGAGDAWPYLKWSEKEVDNLQAVFAQTGIAADARTGWQATEESFKQLGKSGPSPAILHLSTHGFFFPDKTAPPGPPIRGGVRSSPELQGSAADAASPPLMGGGGGGCL